MADLGYSATWPIRPKGRNRLFCGLPLFRDASKQGAIPALGESRESRQRHAFALVFHHHGIALVVGLLKRCRPSAIIRFVMAVCIDALNGRVREWVRSHVIDEGCKGATPFVAYADATSAIVLVVATGLSIAATLHVLPRVPLSADTASIRAAVLRASSDNCCAHAAAAAPAFTQLQIAARDRFHLSAITAAQPVWFQSRRGGSAHNGEQPEPMSGEVNQWRHVHYPSMADIGYNWPI